MVNLLIKIIDSGYFLVKRFLPLKTYRYAVCGGGNLVLDSVLYFLAFHFITQKQNIDLGLIVLSPHIAALFLVFPITFMVGFLLNRHIVFSDSNLPAFTQFFRYLSVGIMALVLSYLAMKLLVDVLSLYPTPSRVLATIMTVLFSYIMQNTFSFKVKKT